MNVVLLNLDLSTPDYIRDAAGFLDKAPVTLIPYVEKSGWTFDLEGGIRAGSSLHCDPLQAASLFSIAPGVMTLKYLHEFLVREKAAKRENIHVVIYLPEYWVIKQLEIHNAFQFEAYATYLSSCMALGYPALSIACESAASSLAYAEKMLGGVQPKVADFAQICREIGILRHMPVGLG